MNPAIVFVVVAPLEKIVCALPAMLASWTVPAVELSVPRMIEAGRLSVQVPVEVIVQVPDAVT